jgi:hypothetical protein
LQCRATELERSNWARISGLADAYSKALLIDPSFRLPPGCQTFAPTRDPAQSAESRNEDRWRYFDTLAWDGKPWREERLPERVVAIGDIHGDLDALASLLRKLELVDNEGHWTGAKTRLVFTGDLVDRGPDSALVLEWVRRLENEAPAQGGRVEALLGNHELMVLSGDYRYVSDEDVANMRRYLKERKLATSITGQITGRIDELSDKELLKIFYGPGGPFTEMLRNENTIAQLGDIVFVHAGLEGWALGRDPGRINSTVRSTVRAQLATHHDRGAKPPLKTRWVLGVGDSRFAFQSEGGPLWTRAFEIHERQGQAIRAPGAPTPQELRDILRSWGAERVIVGHTPQDRLRLSHPLYGDQVLMIDTGISRAYGGPVQALVFEQGEAKSAQVARPRTNLLYRDLRESLFRDIAAAPTAAHSLSPLCSASLANFLH